MNAEARTHHDQVNDSDVVLMFAGDFAEPQEDGYEAPCGGARVNLSSLVREMLSTAFVSLASKGVIELTPARKKRLFSEHRTVVVSGQEQPPDPLGGLDGAILRHLAGKPGQDSVRDIIGRVVGSTTIEPYSAILELSMENSCRAGYFRQEERRGTEAFLGRKTLPKLFQPRCDLIATLASRSAQAQRMREAFKAENEDLYEILFEDVRKSVRAAYFRT